MQFLKYIFAILVFCNSFCMVITDWSLPSALVEGKEARLAITQDGKGIILIAQDKNQKIYSIWSDNGGKNWIKSKSSIGKGFNPTVAVSRDGKIAICVWEDFNTNNILTAYSTNMGHSWTEASSNPLGKGYFPSISINADGQMAVCAWEDSFSADICVAWSSNQGHNWTLEDSIKKACCPSIAITESGKEIVCLYKAFIGDEIYSARSSDFGKKWTVSEPVGQGINPEVVLSKNGKAICSFTNIQKNQVYLSHSNFLGETWSNPYPLSPGEFSSLSVNKDGDVAICACQAGDIIQTYYSLDSGKNWSKYSNSESGCRPCVALNAEGTKAIRVFMDSNDMINITECPYSILIVHSKQVRNIYRKDIVNEIFWDGLPEAKLYKIYSDSSLTSCVYKGTDLKFYDYGIKKNESRIYYVVWIDDNGKQSAPVITTVP